MAEEEEEEAGIKAFAENVADVAVLFQLRATCRWLKEICDERLRLVKPSIGGSGDLLNDLTRNNNREPLLRYPKVPCVVDAALCRLPTDVVAHFMIDYLDLFGEAVISASTVRAVLRAESKIGWHTLSLFAESVCAQNKNDECVAELYSARPVLFWFINRRSRLARISLNFPALRERVLRGGIEPNPFANTENIMGCLVDLTEAWKLEDGLREFYPLSVVLRRQDLPLMAAFMAANGKAYETYLTRM